MTSPEWLLVGIIVKPQGLKGEMRVKIKTDFPEKRFAPDSSLSVFHPTIKGLLRVTVAHSRPHKGVYIVKFHELNSIEQVDQLRGAEIKIPIQETYPLEEDEYYFHDIIGCEVVTTEGVTVGTVKDILQTGANDVWVVARDNGEKDLLLPYIDDVIKRVSTTEKQIVIEWMDGLE